jgi:hypothetical protein
MTSVLRRELQRCAEISVVALQDKRAAADADKQARADKAAGIVKPKGPNMTLIAGKKGPEGRVVHPQ